MTNATPDYILSGYFPNNLNKLTVRGRLAIFISGVNRRHALNRLCAMPFATAHFSFKR